MPNEKTKSKPEPAPQQQTGGDCNRLLFCDGCGKVHDDTDEFLMCDCGRIACRMEWATPEQIARAEWVKLFAMPMPENEIDYKRRLMTAYLMGQTSQGDSLPNA